MGEASIPVDLFNPGQVFACLGLLEAADALCGEAEGGFDWSDPAAVRFVLRARGEESPVAVVLGFLTRAEVRAVAPPRSRNDTSKWEVPRDFLPEEAPFPFPDPSSPATLPVWLCHEGRCLVLDHWGDATRRDNVKFWAGAGGFPGAGLARDALDLVRDRLPAATSDPFALAAPQSSSFRFDWRRDYVPLDAGFSLNEHANITPRGYPLVELLAALGLSHARPLRLHKLEYRYAVVGRRLSRDSVHLPLLLLRAALGCAALPFPTRTFRMNLDWPGQEGQARCITSVSEEIAP
jgi:CRISPR-associated protein Csb3